MSEAGLADGLDRLLAESRQQPYPGTELRLETVDGFPLVTGTVLTRGQGAAVRELARHFGAGVEVSVRADPDAALELGWAEGVEAWLTLWREPGRFNDDAARQAEYTRSDGPLRVLAEVGDAALVQGPDLALGWVPRTALRGLDAAAARAAWAGMVRAEEGRAVLPDPARLTLEAGPDGVLVALVAAARSRLGLPYRWGGTSPVGVDCSGLVQRAFSEATGVVLPKHSAEQRRMGARVATDEAAAGDLLFATPRDHRVGHVLLVTAPGMVLHACRAERRVIEESIEANAARYQHRGYRRPVLLRP
ncbi:MAG: C40 family peptidase [Candidatus Dormibacteria bacterium]